MRAWTRWQDTKRLTLAANVAGARALLPSTRIAATALPGLRKVFVQLVASWREGRVDLLNVAGAVPDGGTLVVLDGGPMAPAVAKLWAGEKLARGTDLEDVALLLIVRPRVMISVEEEVRVR